LRLPAIESRLTAADQRRQSATAGRKRNRAVIMSKLSLRQVLLSVLVVLLFSPVVLATGSAGFRPALYSATLGGLPAFSLLVIGLLLLFMVLVCILAASVFAGSGKEDGR
jgi:hypothetical protein